MRSKEDHPWIINIAALISIGTLFLYILGWIYWLFFFNRLDISFSIIDLTFEKMVSTTWIFIVAILLWLIMLAGFLYSPEKVSIDVLTVIYSFAVTLLMSSFSLFEYKYYYLIFIAVPFVSIKYILSKINIKIPYINQHQLLYTTISACVIASLVYYGYRGHYDATKSLKDNKNDIEIVLKSKEILKARYLAKTSQMLVLLTLDQKTYKIIMVNQDEILTISKSLVRL